MSNPTKFMLILLLILFQAFSFQRMSTNNLQQMIENPPALNSSQGEFIDFLISSDLMKEIISFAYIKHGKNKTANAKQITQKLNAAKAGYYWIAIIVDEGASQTKPEYYYCSNSMNDRFWAYWDDVNPSEDWMYLLSGHQGITISYDSKLSQSSEKGKGITAAMQKMIRAIVAKCGGESEMEEVNCISSDLTKYLSEGFSIWNTLGYKCSIGITMGDSTPVFNYYWYLLKTPLIAGTDDCYFIFESTVRPYG